MWKCYYYLENGIWINNTTFMNVFNIGEIKFRQVNYFVDFCLDWLLHAYISISHAMYFP